MNRRQKKKAFKKKYGYNPPKTSELKIEIDWKAVAEDMASLGVKARETIEYVANVIIPDFVERVSEMLKDMQKAVNELVEKIKEMPEEEWQEFKKELTEEQIQLAERIRRRKSNE